MDTAMERHVPPLPGGWSEAQRRGRRRWREGHEGVATGTSLGCAPVLYETLAAVFTCRAITLVDLACILFLFNSL